MNTADTHNSGLLLEQSQTLIMPRPSAINFAPGVIQRFPRDKKTGLRYWLRALTIVLHLMLLTAALGFGFGFVITKAGWL